MQQPLQFRTRDRRIRRTQCRAGPNHIIQAPEIFAGVTKNVARDPLVEITCHRRLHDALADNHAKTRSRPGARSNIYLEPAPAAAALIGKNSRIRVRPVEALRARKGKFPATAQALDSEASATLGATCTNDRTTGTRFHAHAETVRSLAPRR